MRTARSSPQIIKARSIISALPAARRNSIPILQSTHDKTGQSNPAVPNIFLIFSYFLCISDNLDLSTGSTFIQLNPRCSSHRTQEAKIWVMSQDRRGSYWRKRYMIIADINLKENGHDNPANETVNEPSLSSRPIIIF